jgi:arylsulfatase
MKRRQFLADCAKASLLAPLLPLASGLAAPAPERPDILLIMIDDAGFSDVGCFGGEIPTPNLDALARSGVRFTNFYAESVCAPTRGSLLTGLYPQQAGLAINNVKHDDPFWKSVGNKAYLGPRPEVSATIAELLRPAGYQTFMTGKWHHGDYKGQWPCDRGFDRSFALIWGASNHMQPRWAPFALDDKPFKDFPPDFYTTDYFTRYALQFLNEADRDRPLFLYLSYSAPHTPFQAPEEVLQKYRDFYPSEFEKIRSQRLARQKSLGLFRRQTPLAPIEPWVTNGLSHERRANLARNNNVYAAMVARLDQRIGEVLKTLRRLGRLENTLVIFLSDNGPAPGRGLPWACVGATPLRGFKGNVYEGGIRVPFIASWPGRTPPGTINRRQVGHVMDLVPTFLQVAGAAYPREIDGRRLLPLEGISLAEALREPDHHRSRTHCWDHLGSSACRAGDLKLVRCYRHGFFRPEAQKEPPASWELYDLAADPTETTDLAARRPDKVQELTDIYETWARRVGVLPRAEVLRHHAQWSAKQQKEKP